MRAGTGRLGRGPDGGRDSDVVIDVPGSSGRGIDLFLCPECREALVDLACATCGVSYGGPDGIPDLLGHGVWATRYREVCAYYNDLYSGRTDVWREQGHTDHFTRYVADLVEARGPGRYLDVGCGEGYFLAEARTMDGFGIDLSRQALLRARARAGATVAIAAAERLPFPDKAFDVVTSVGAMEHFLDDVTAVAEIRRVLRSRGRYIVALLIETTLGSRVTTKVREFLWPRPRPAALSRWLLGKVLGPAEVQPAREFPHQPVQNRYRPAQVRRLVRHSGFDVTRVITAADNPEAPLPGHYMRIYCLESI